MTEHPVHAKTMQGQGLLQPLFEARGRRLIPLFQLAVELLEGLKRLLVRRPAVRALQPLALQRLLALGQIAHDILSFVPLATAHDDPPSKGLGHGSSQPLAAVDDHQQPFRDIETPLDQ